MILVKFAKRNIIFLRVFFITIGSNGRGLCRGPEFWSGSRSCFFLFFLLRGFFCDYVSGTSRNFFTSRTCFLVIPRGTIIRFLGKLLVFPLSCVDYHACLLAILYWLSALSNEYVTVFV